jgi:hypothetical protein
VLPLRGSNVSDLFSPADFFAEQIQLHLETMDINPAEVIPFGRTQPRNDVTTLLDKVVDGAAQIH